MIHNYWLKLVAFIVGNHPNPGHDFAMLSLYALAGVVVLAIASMMTHLDFDDEHQRAAGIALIFAFLFTLLGIAFTVATIVSAIDMFHQFGHISI